MTSQYKKLGDTQSFHDTSGFRHGPVWRMVLNSTLGMFMFGYSLSVLNTTQDYIQNKVYHWTDSQANLYISLLNSLLTIGAGIGAFLGGTAAQRYGRRKSMIITDCLTFAGILLTLIRNVIPFIAGRIITGFCAGLNSSLVPLYVIEVAPLSLRGPTGICTQLFICIGSLFAYLSGFGLPKGLPEGFVQENWWRIMLGFPLTTSAFRMLILKFCYKHETPKYLVYHDQEKEARKVLELLYIGDYATEQLIWLKREREEDLNAHHMHYSELLSKKYRRRLWIGCFINVSQQMTGINALILYSTQIFKDNSDGDQNAAILDTTLFGILNLVATLFAGQVLKKFGRKTILLFGGLGMSACIAVISTLYYLDLGSYERFPIFVYIAVFGLSYGPIVYVFTAEILPDIGVGIANLVNWLGTFLVAQFYEPLQKMTGTGLTFGVFGVYSVISSLVIMCKVKETRGLTPVEINDIYNPPEDSTREFPDMQKVIRGSKYRPSEPLRVSDPSISSNYSK